jgi:hypothetical protein
MMERKTRESCSIIDSAVIIYCIQPSRLFVCLSVYFFRSSVGPSITLLIFGAERTCIHDTYYS